MAYAQQNSTTQGKEFYVSFMPNNHSAPTLKLLISAKRTCNVNISGNGYNANVRVTAGSTITHTITKNSAAYTYTSATVSKKALKVT
ncbi:MAG: hypothetical protein ACRCZB_01910, partial [Bacteroidales bacterium]